MSMVQSHTANGAMEISSSGYSGDMPTECAGCKRTGLPLLVCDDCLPDGSPMNSSDWSKQRFCANCMIGKKVRVFWPLDEQWYVGVVQQYDRNTGEHQLKYPDGDTEWVKIGDTPSNVAAREREQRQQAERERNKSTSVHPEMHHPGGPQSQSGHGQSQGQQYSMSPYGNRGSNISPEAKGNSHQQSSTHYGNPSFNQQMSPQSGQDWQMNHKNSTGVESSGNNADPALSSSHSGMPMTPQQQPMSYSHQHMQQSSQGNSPGGRPQYGMPPSHIYPPPHHGPPPNIYNRPSYILPRGYNYPSHHPQAGMHGGMPGTPIHADSKQGSTMHTPTSDHPPDEAPNSSSKRKSGPKTWTKEEDAILLNMVQNMRMPMKWSIVAQSMPDRTGKQCRERYVNHLNPRLKNTDWNPNEDATIFHLYNAVGSQWAKMSKMIPGRTDNGIKNRFHNLRRQLEREDEHRMRLSKAQDFPENIHVNRIREKWPLVLKGRNDTLWDMHKGIGIIAAQSITGEQSNTGTGITRNVGKFGPFRLAKTGGEQCFRCGLIVPSTHCGTEICEVSKWCKACTRIPPHISGNLLRECLNLRKSEFEIMAKVVAKWSLNGLEKAEESKEATTDDEEKVKELKEAQPIKKED